MNTHRIFPFVLFLYVLGAIFNCNLFSNNEDGIQMNGRNFFSIEAIQEKYPNNKTLNMNIPQTIIKKVQIKEIFDSEDLTIRDISNNNIARLYSFNNNNEHFQFKIIVTKSSLNAYNEALSLISSNSCALFQIDSSNPYFLGDWCVVNTINKDGKYPPSIIIFTKNNVTVYGETSSKTNIRFFWNKMVVVNEKLSNLGEYIKNPYEIKMKDIEKDIDQPTELQNKTYKSLEENILLRSKKKYQYDLWPNDNLKPRGEIKVSSSIFPKAEIIENQDSSDLFRDMRLHIKDSSIKEYDVKIRIWIFPTVEEAQGKFLLLLDEWKVPPSARMKDGPGHIAFDAGKDGIMFLYSNVVYESEREGINHLDVARSVAEIIEKSPELKSGEKPGIIIKYGGNE